MRVIGCSLETAVKKSIMSKKGSEFIVEFFCAESVVGGATAGKTLSTETINIEADVNKTRQ
jgi:hypothetical protein